MPIVFDYKTIVIPKPEAYNGINRQSAEALFKNDQQVLRNVRQKSRSLSAHHAEQAVTLQGRVKWHHSF